MGNLLWVVGISLSVSFLCSVLEAVLLSITDPFVGVLKERGDQAGEYLEAMQDKIDEPIAAILTLNTIAHTVGAVLAGAMVEQLFGSAWLTAFSVALTLAVLVFSEIIPKTLGATYWKQFARPTAYILRGLTIGMKFIVVPLSLFNRLLTSKGERPTVSRAEIEVLAEIGRREGTLDEREFQVMSNVMNLRRVLAGQVMTPRTDIVAVPVDATVEHAKTVMLEEGHLRLPVHDGGLDRIVGLLLARDLWSADREGEHQVRSVMRPIQFAPATKSVEELIPEMRQQRTKMVMVVDEFGGTAGLVTLEDLIEEIVGEIHDEHEEDGPLEFEDLGDGHVRIQGGALLAEVSDRFKLALNDDLHETLAGHLFGRLARVPEVGDKVSVDGGVFRVTRMNGRRIEAAVFEPRPDGS